MMMSQLSQPNCSISARDMGRNGAVPKRDAQYLRYDVRSLATADIGQLHGGNGVGVGRSGTLIYVSPWGTIRAGAYAGQHHFLPLKGTPGDEPGAGWAAV